MIYVLSHPGVCKQQGRVRMQFCTGARTVLFETCLIACFNENEVGRNRSCVILILMDFAADSCCATGP